MEYLCTVEAILRDPLNFVPVIGRDGQSRVYDRVVSICFVENFYSGAEDLLSNISIHRLLYVKDDLPVKKFSIVSANAPEIKQMYWAI